MCFALRIIDDEIACAHSSPTGTNCGFVRTTQFMFTIERKENDYRLIIEILLWYGFFHISYYLIESKF